MTKIRDLHRRWSKDTDYKDAYDAPLGGGRSMDSGGRRSDMRMMPGLPIRLAAR